MSPFKDNRSMRLIISEKPSMGRCHCSGFGHSGERGATSSRAAMSSSPGVWATWCRLWDRKYTIPGSNRGDMDTLPFFPDPFRYFPIEATNDQYEVVAQLLTRDDVTDVVNATDAGREGELIFDLVYRLSGCTKPVLRFWTSSLTDNAIREAYGRMKPGEAYSGLRDAAR